MLSGFFAEFFSGDFLDGGVEFLLEEDEGLVGAEFVDNLADIVAVLCDGAGRLFEALLVLGIVFRFLFRAGFAENVFDVVDDFVLGRFERLDFVEGVVEEFPFKRGDIGVGPFFLDRFGSDFFVVAAGEDPAFEESLGHGGVEVVEELFADLVDEEDLALFVVGFFDLSGYGLAEFVDVFDVLTGEDFFEEFFVEFGGGDERAAADFEADVAFEFLRVGVGEAENLFDNGGGESLGGVDDDGIFGFFTDEESGDFGILDVGEFEGAESADATFELVAFFVQFDGFAIDMAPFGDSLRGFEFAKTLCDFINLRVDVLGSDFDGIEFGVDFFPFDVEVGEEGCVEEEGEVLVLSEIGGTGFFVVGEWGADDVEVLIVDIFIERLTQEILHGVGDDGGFVDALN